MSNKPKTIKLIELTAELESGSRPSGGASSETDGIPSLGAEHLNDCGGFNFSNIKYVPMEFFNSMKRGVIKQDDILIVKDGATTGKVSFVNGNFPFEQASINEHVFSLRINKEQAFPKYIFYRLFSEEGKKAILKDFRGATVGGISKGFTEKVSIPLPSIQAQQKIAAILDKADALRQKDKQLLAKYDELAQAVFYDMFGRSVAEKGWRMVDLTELYINPKEGTKCGPFGSALKKEEYVNDGVPVWTMFNINESAFIEEGCLYITPEKYAELIGYRAKSGDIIISRAGTVGKMCVVKTDRESSIIHSNIIRLRLDAERLLPEVFVSAMKFWGDEMIRLKKGADGAFTHMSTGILDNISFPDVPMATQQKFHGVLQQIRKQKNDAQKELQKSEELFQSLLQKAFNGELDI